MKKIKILLLAILLGCVTLYASKFESVKPTKNVIVLIPDGTSLSTVSLARWYQWYNNPNKPLLHIDPLLCGTVRTTSSNAPIGDSAPTTSTYMTGYLSRTGYVSTYPVADPQNDIIPTDPQRAYQPLTTVLEASKWLHNRATGLVFTCEFPHATPADCSAHSYNRAAYNWIAPQMVHNDLQVVLGGGTALLSQESFDYLKENGYGVFKDDIAGMRAFEGDKLWALYGKKDMAYDIDRNPNEQPSIEEMTRLAIRKLSKNENGFFLMVEGSKVDWAAHANDPIAMATEFLAFDRACGAALEFAKTNGETTVLILPDHGNSGLSIGSAHCPGYDKLTKDQLFAQFSQYTASSERMAADLNSTPVDAKTYLKEKTGLELSTEELDVINNCAAYKNSPIPADQRKVNNEKGSLYSNSLAGILAKLMTAHTCFAFTTGGHTGEDVFLAAYHPQGDVPMGMNTNIEINQYLCAVSGFNTSLDHLTAAKFAPHTDVFSNYKAEIIPAATKDDFPTLVVKSKKDQLTIRPFTNIVVKGVKKKQTQIKLSSVVVYVDKNNTFYLPAELSELLNP